MTHPSRGQLPGPYTKLPGPSPLRRLALDVIATISMISLGQKQDDELEVAVGIATAGTEEADYWIQLSTVFG
jgi:pre-rRNA-processing protein IPI1